MNVHVFFFPSLSVLFDVKRTVWTNPTCFENGPFECESNSTCYGDDNLIISRRSQNGDGQDPQQWRRRRRENSVKTRLQVSTRRVYLFFFFFVDW